MKADVKDRFEILKEDLDRVTEKQKEHKETITELENEINDLKGELKRMGVIK